jgi:hypothetical protein
MMSPIKYCKKVLIVIPYVPQTVAQTLVQPTSLVRDGGSPADVRLSSKNAVAKRRTQASLYGRDVSGAEPACEQLP